jgi:hypothetical protein
MLVISISVSVCKSFFWLCVLNIPIMGAYARLGFRPSSSNPSLWNKVNQQVQSGLLYTKLNCNFAFHISQVHRIAVYLNRDIFQKGVDCVIGITDF